MWATIGGHRHPREIQASQVGGGAGSADGNSLQELPHRIYQTEIRGWRARIRRLDGKKVKVAATGEQHEFLPTAAAGGAMTPRTAIDVAKALIDDGSID